MIAGLINASEAVVLLAVVSRTNGIYDAGVLTIAFAVGNLMTSIGKFGMRNYQVTDVNEQFSFDTYFSSRIITVGLMILTVLFYVIYGYFFKQYTLSKMCVIFLICMVYSLEAIEDVFAGWYQKRGRLDIGGKIFSVRWSIALVVFIVALLYTHSLLWATLFLLLSSFICCAILLRYTFSYVYKERIHMNYVGVGPLLLRCAPLFFTSFMQFYLINASKYAIDNYLTEEIQACYGFVSMPVFVIGLLNSFFYQPILVQIAVEWREHDYEGVTKRVSRQFVVIFFITLICLMGAYVLGIPVLSTLYSTDLHEYKTELLILLLGGGFLAVVGFFSVVLTTMRKQKWVLVGYTMVTVLTFCLTGKVVQVYGVLGAAGIYTFMIAILSIFLGVVVGAYLLDRLKYGTESDKIV